MPRMTPVNSILKCRDQPIAFADDAAAAVVEMQMGQQHIGDIVAMKAGRGQ